MNAQFGDDRAFQEADQRSESKTRSEAYKQVGFAKLDRNHRAERENA